MSKHHTPGPWLCKPLQSYAQPGYAVFWKDTSKPGIHSRRLDYQGCFTEADARLVAAAPDLLASLIEVVRISDRKHDAWDAAKAAIAKATEVQP